MYEVQHFHVWLGWRCLYRTDKYYKALCLLGKIIIEDAWVRFSLGDHAIIGHGVVAVGKSFEEGVVK